jgi:hypothetical protein
MTKGDFCGSVSEGITGSLRSQGGRSTQAVFDLFESITLKSINGVPSVDLYDTVFPRSGIQSVLDVTLANDTKMPDYFESSAS